MRNVGIAVMICLSMSLIRVAGAAEPTNLERQVIGVESCQKEVAQFSVLNADAVEQWRRRNAQALRAIEKDPESRQRIEEGVRAELDRMNASDQQSRDLTARLCNTVLVRMLGGKPSIGAGSPTEAWNRFVAALKSADAEAALSMMDAGMLPQWRRSLSQMKAEGMQKFASGIVGELNIVDQQLGTARAVVKLKSGREAPVEFTEDNGRWLITAM